ncbi:hypothetical protein, partial [Longirhabdus pacifica]|uniref:hypothetical protein n=1 Tax=Longirhabdus pacifica TaxID=2305227 RepID=UPI0019821AA8
VRLSKKEKYSFWNITLRFPKGKNIGSESKMKNKFELLDEEFKQINEEAEAAKECDDIEIQTYDEKYMMDSMRGCGYALEENDEIACLEEQEKDDEKHSSGVDLANSFSKMIVHYPGFEYDSFPLTECLYQHRSLKEISFYPHRSFPYDGERFTISFSRISFSEWIVLNQMCDYHNENDPYMESRFALYELMKKEELDDVVIPSSNAHHEIGNNEYVKEHVYCSETDDAHTLSYRLFFFYIEDWPKKYGFIKMEYVMY